MNYKRLEKLISLANDSYDIETVAKKYNNLLENISQSIVEYLILQETHREEKVVLGKEILLKIDRLQQMVADMVHEDYWLRGKNKE